MVVVTDFFKFSVGVFKGLVQAFTTDIDVFLLVIAGLLLGGRKGLGKAFLIYVIARRTDQYAGLFASKLDQISLVIAKGDNTNDGRH